MEQEEVSFFVELPDERKVYEESFNIYGDSLFTHCSKTQRMDFIGQEIIRDFFDRKDKLLAGIYELYMYIRMYTSIYL